MQVRKRVAAVLALALLSACGGGGATSGRSVVPAPSLVPPGAPNAPTQYAQVSVSIALPSQSTSAVHRQYVSAGTQSAQISVAPAGGTAQTPVTVNCTTVCSGTVNAPAGSDTFTVKLFSGQNAQGSLLSLGSATQNIVIDQANTVNLTFDGVVSSLSLSVGNATAGTSGTIPVTLSAKDASGNTIVGAASFVDSSGAPLTITLSNNDTSGATQLSTTSVTSPASPTLSYTGLAIAPITLSASAPGITAAHAQFAPTLAPIQITYTDTLNPSFQGIDLTQPSGTASFTASEAGFTGSFGHAFTITPGSGCATIGSIAQGASTTSYTATAAASPSAGSCTITLSDTVGQSATVALYYTRYSASASTQSLTIPTAVTQANVTVAGGSGGGGFYSVTQANGGAGTTVAETIPLTAGTAYSITAGTAGGSSFFNGTYTAGTPGQPGGGSGANWGGGGGGYSAFALGSTNLIVAGGGGGGAASYTGLSNGGTGGSFSSLVSTASNVISGGVDGKGAGTAGGGHNGGSSGGAGGVSTAGCANGTNGSAFQGGTGGAEVCGGGGGAGGGGGYYGGGGGASATAFGSNEASGGGGAGSSYFFASSSMQVTNVVVTGGANAGDGYVIVQF